MRNITYTCMYVYIVPYQKAVHSKRGEKILTDHSLVLLVASIPAMAPETIPKEDISNLVQDGTPTPVINWL